MGVRQEGILLVDDTGGGGGGSEVTIVGCDVTLPVDVQSSVLPTGASTSANQSTEITRLTSILAQLDVALSTRAAESTLASILSGLGSLGTEATLLDILTQLDIPLSDLASQTTLASILSALQGTITTQGESLSVAVVQATASGNTTLISAPASNNQIKLKRVELSNSHASTDVVAGIRFGAAGTIFGKAYLPFAGGAKVIQVLDDYILGGDATALIVNLSAGSQVECTAYYETVPFP